MENKILKTLIVKLTNQFDQISEERLKLLQDISSKIKFQLEEFGSADIIVVCTHNSRRSQLGEAWISTACQYYNLDHITAFSGGTAATSFNIRMIVAMRHGAFHLQTEQPADNPRYMLTALKHTEEPHFMFSKTYDDPFNPQDNFIALMVCTDADENCPIVKGAAHRFSLPYLDPKAYDDTPMEHDAYVEKVDEIGREFLYMISQVRDQV